MARSTSRDDTLQDSDRIITLSEARRALGRRRVDRVLAHDRHHHDQHGRPYWLLSDWSEAVELVEIEDGYESGGVA
jgi:hypothetical protein